jgi:CTP-dependent riboflavin kinase
MGKPRQFMVHTLSDGTKVTAADVASKLECSITTARCRLTRSKDVKKVYARLTTVGKQSQGRYKFYTLDDDSEWTVAQIANHTGLSKNAVAGRLHKSRKPEEVLRPKSTNGAIIKEPRISEAVKQSMYFDPLGHWKLLNKYS